MQKFLFLAVFLGFSGPVAFAQTKGDVIVPPPTKQDGSVVTPPAAQADPGIQTPPPPNQGQLHQGQLPDDKDKAPKGELRSAPPSRNPL